MSEVSKLCGIKQLLLTYGFETSAIVFFLMPITLISILYVLIGLQLRRSANQIKMIEPNSSASGCGGGGGGNVGSAPGSPKDLLTQYHEVTNTHETQPISTASQLQLRHNSVSSGSQQKQVAGRRSVIRMLGK